MLLASGAREEKWAVVAAQPRACTHKSRFVSEFDPCPLSGVLQTQPGLPQLRKVPTGDSALLGRHITPGYNCSLWLDDRAGRTARKSLKFQWNSFEGTSSEHLMPGFKKAGALPIICWTFIPSHYYSHPNRWLVAPTTADLCKTHSIFGADRTVPVKASWDQKR